MPRSIGGPQHVRVDQSSVNGAPQCPSCWAHTMVRHDDGMFRCPSGCPGSFVELQVGVNDDAALGTEVVLDGVLGLQFVQLGTA